MCLIIAAFYVFKAWLFIRDGVRASPAVASTGDSAVMGASAQGRRRRSSSSSITTTTTTASNSSSRSKGAPVVWLGIDGTHACA